MAFFQFYKYPMYFLDFEQWLESSKCWLNGLRDSNEGFWPDELKCFSQTNTICAISLIKSPAFIINQN